MGETVQSMRGGGAVSRLLQGKSLEDVMHNAFGNHLKQHNIIQNCLKYYGQEGLSGTFYNKKVSVKNPMSF